MPIAINTFLKPKGVLDYERSRGFGPDRTTDEFDRLSPWALSQGAGIDHSVHQLIVEVSRRKA